MTNIDLYDEFFELLKNYTNVFYKNLLANYINNPKYLEMLYVKGIFLLKNIYILLFFYCETISEVLLIVEKAYIYYIEFLIQINLNSNLMNLELTLRDAVLFTYKRTLLIYKKQNTNNIANGKINKEIDTCLNILCNIFYLIDNINFIEYNEELITCDISNINLFVINKINNIKQLQVKLRKYVINNTNLTQLNNIMLQLRDNIEKKIDNKIDNMKNNLDTKINTKINTKIHNLFDNYQTSNLLLINTCLNEFD
jgi:hypothetical protein